MKCPHCGGNLYLSGTPPRGVRLPKKANQHAYEFGAESITDQPWENADPLPSIQSARLERGERRKAERYRAIDMNDVTTSAWRSIGNTIAATIISAGATVGINALITGVWPAWVFRLPWYTPFAIGPIYGAVKWLNIDTEQLGKDLLLSLEELTRTDLDGDGQIGEVGQYNVSGEVRDGQTTIYTKFSISDPWAWHRFCKAVHEGQNFSLRTANDAGVKQPEYKRIVDLWASADPARQLIVPSSVGERLTIVLTKMGQLMVKSFALTPPQGVA